MGRNTSQLIRFGAAGGANTILTFVAFTLMVWAGLYYPIANAITWVIGMTCAYLLNARFVFKDVERPRNEPRTMVLFATMYLLNLAISSAALVGLVEAASLDPVRAQLVVIPIIAVLSFIFARFIVFKRTTEDRLLNTSHTSSRSDKG